jgi:hypothetical protein
MKIQCIIIEIDNIIITTIQIRILESAFRLKTY